MPYCVNCGKELVKGAKFCYECGAAVNNVPPDTTPKREQEFAGKIIKCPNCGEALQSFLTVCPTCEYEIREINASTSVRELALKLENISAQKMPTFEEKKSVIKMVFGKDFKEGNEAEEALRRFERQKEEEKASLIINFSVPNSKEDIMEFMILASSNIDVKKGVDDEVTKAWLSKLEQVYQKAEITMGNNPDFAQIKSIYDRKKKELKSKRNKRLMIGVGSVAGCIFLLGLLLNPVATIGILVLVLIVIGYILFKKR